MPYRIISFAIVTSLILAGLAALLASKGHNNSALLGVSFCLFVAAGVSVIKRKLEREPKQTSANKVASI